MPNKYIGEKYAATVAGAWDINMNYERLTIVTHDNKAYISRRDIPAVLAIDIGDSNYWCLLFATSGSPGSVNWMDILDKPSAFPPEFHTQPWSTITDTPTDYPPSPHTHPIDQVNGLDTTLTGIQTNIDKLIVYGREIAARFVQQSVITDTVTGTHKMTWDGIVTRNSTAFPIFDRDATGDMYINHNVNDNYDVYCGALITLNKIGGDPDYPRVLTITNFLFQNAVQFKIVPGAGSPPFHFAIPQYFVGTVVSNPLFKMSASINLYAGDEVGGNTIENYLTLKGKKTTL